jgi:PAS domain-containing protein
MAHIEGKSISSFPVKTLIVSLVLTMALFAFLCGLIWNSYSDFKKAQHRDFRLLQLSGVIVHLDEVLTMSARLAAITGELRWEKRYRHFEPQLDASIKEAKLIAPDPFGTRAAAQTDAANIKLVEMENRAFDFVRKGERATAKSLLFSKEYEKEKRLYSEGMAQITAELEEHAQSALMEQRRRGLFAIACVVVSLPVLLFVWLGTIRLTKRHITERERAEKALLESEARYKGVVEHTINGVAVYQAVNDGEDFTFVDFNKSAERIEKIKRDQVIGREVSEVFPGVKEFGLLEVMKSVWASGKPEHHPVAHYKDQRIAGWRENFVYKLPSGEIVAVYSDETERKQAEEALRNAHDELYELSQELEKKVQERTEELKEKNKDLVEAERLAAQGKMANRIAHELRNPLTVVGGLTRRLREKAPGDDPSREFLEIIVGEVIVLENKVSEIIEIREY